MKKHTKAQKIKEIQFHKDSSRGEHSPYGDYMEARGGSTGHTQECAQANPDILPETEVVVTSPSTPQLLFGEAINHLQGRQKEVYLLTMREDKSLTEVAQVLKISKGTAQKYKERAIKFLTQYCQSAIKAGRV